MNKSELQFLQPRILKYHVAEKGISTPYTSFVRSKEGHLVIGGMDGLLVIRGSETYVLGMQGPVCLTADRNGRIYYLSDGDFGFLKLFKNEPPQAFSITGDIDSHFLSFIPFNVISSGSRVLFATSEGVFITGKGKTRHFFFDRKDCRLFTDEEHVFLWIEKEGLRILRGDEFEPVEFGGGLQQAPGSLFKFDSKTYLSAHDGSVYEFFDSTFVSTTFPGEIKEFSHAFNLPGNFLLVNGKDIDPRIISESGKVVNRPGPPASLPQYPICTVFPDEFGDSWILYDFGLYKMEYPSLVYTAEMPDELKGAVLGARMKGQDIYLATSSGVAHIRTIGDEKWEYTGIISPEKDEYINLIRKAGDQVIAAGNRSLYLLNGTTCLLIDNGNFSEIFPREEGKIFACSDSGFMCYRLEGGTWKRHIIDPGLKSARNITFHNELVWIIDGDGNLHTATDEEILPSGKNMPKGEPFTGAFVFDSALYITSAETLWKADPGTTGLNRVKDEKLIAALKHSINFVQAGEGAWYVENNQRETAFLNYLDLHKGVTQNICLPYPGFIQRIIDLNHQDGNVWVTGESGMIRVEPEVRKGEIPDRLILDRVSYLANGSPEAITVQPGEKISWFRGSVEFRLFNRRYQADPGPLYRYRLTPVNEGWSDWTHRRSISFSGLGSGRYAFEGQMKSVSGNISDPVSFSFAIKPPALLSWYAISIYIMLLLFLLFLMYKWRMLGLKKVEVRMQTELRDKMEQLIREKDKADRLVADLFPKGTAEELKLSGRAKSRKFDMATVLFSDIQGFSHIAEEMNPEVLIDELDKFFFHFDSVVEKYNIEKIKTIGDAYMAAGGIPLKNTTNPVEVVLAGLEMQYYMAELKKTKAEIWDLRIGIHTGPVVSGVVGHKKLSYDIWGDTVNTASRMESSGEPGRVNISGATYSLVKEYFICEYRGKLPVKYKGNIDMYFVNGLRPELSVDLQGIPNRRFFLKLQLLRLNDLESYVFEEHLREYPVTLHFHNKAYLKRVYDHVELLCRSENISDEDTLITRTAGLLVFCGITETTENFEIRSAAFAREILPDYGYSEEQTSRICNLILATKQPFQPQNKLEEVLIDARMEYLGRPDYIRLVKLMFLEQKNTAGVTAIDQVVAEQIHLQDNFNYFTLAGKRLREISAADQKVNLDNIGPK